MPKDVLAIIEEEQERRQTGVGLSRFVLLKNKKDEATIRFIDELKHDDKTKVASTVSIHEIGGKKTGEEFRTVLCTGVGCQYCEDNIRKDVHVLLRAFVYSVGNERDQEKGVKAEKVLEVKIIDVKARADAMVDLASDFKRKGNITRADYIYHRTATGLDTRYRFIRQEPKEFKYPKALEKTKITKKELREIVEQRWAERKSAKNGKDDDDDDD